MWKSKVAKYTVISLIIFAMLMASSCALFNKPPEITSLTSSAISVAPGGNCTVTCTASDPDGDTLTYQWAATGGAVSGGGSTVTWIAPAVVGGYTISVTVSDGKGETASNSLTIPVVNTPPVIASVTPSATSIAPESNCTITCTASDADGDALTYQWTASGGDISGEGSAVTWEAPVAEGNYTISVTVGDGKGGTASGNCVVEVEKKFGSIDIESSPSGAVVFLDGVDTGSITPFVISNVEPGNHTVKLVLYHYKYREQTVEVNADETTYVNWSLTYAPEEVVTIQPNAAAGKDASVDVAMPGSNYGTHYEIAAGRGTADTVRAYIQFDLSPIPEDIVIIEADLGLFYYRSVGGLITAPIGAYAVHGSWNESNLTWNNQPDYAGSPEYVRPVPASVTNDFIYWSLDDLVESWINRTIRNYGLVLKDTDESTVEVWKGFYSSDWGTASERPKLVVRYFDPTP